MGFLSNLITKKETFQRVTRRAKAVPNPRSQFRGVQLNPNTDSCCKAVREAVGKRYLSHEVPMLPLADCDSSDCRCTYQLFDDRRTDIRRAGDVVNDLFGQLRLHNRRSDEVAGRRSVD